MSWSVLMPTVAISVGRDFEAPTCQTVAKLSKPAHPAGGCTKV